MLPSSAFLRAASPRAFIVSFVCLLSVMLAACGGGSSSSSSSNNSSSSGSGSSSVATSTIAAAASNVATITVEQGPSANFANLPFVTVKVCAVGTTTCDTVSHVLLDSESVGLRVVSANLPNSLASMTREMVSSSYLNECGTFASGYTWGTVRLADMTISGESASNVPIQVIGDPAAGSTAPGDCMTNGSNNDLSTVSALGANGILGVEGLAVDCGASCVSASNNIVDYYACDSTGNTCTIPAVPTAKQLSNVVRSFATDNNGVIIEMPQISTSGAVSVSGSLVFGIGTQSNNALGQATVLQTDSGFNFKSTYNGVAYANSFVDSGSSDYFFYDASLTRCTTATGYYCPSSITTKTATFAPSSGSSSASYTASFSIANAETLFNTANYAFNDSGVYQVGSTTSGMDFGMPFFYGKNVFVKDETTSGAADGYLAFIGNTN